MQARALESASDYEQAVELQRLTWGETYTELVTPSLQKVTQRIGGIAAGMFDDAGVLLGFVYGLSGWYEGGLAHWSHMLAVRPKLRDRGIGRALKEFQRDRVRELGINTIYWTFDPLVARNAQLNLVLLGAALREYVPDMYWITGSGLHAFGTDRFIVAWPVSGSGSQAPATQAEADVLDLSTIDSEAVATVTSEHRPVIISVPEDISALSLEQALRWRGRTRAAFLSALAAGYRVVGFDRERSAYLLTTNSG